MEPNLQNKTTRRLAEARRWGEKMARAGRDHEHVEERITARGSALSAEEAEAVRQGWAMTPHPVAS